MRHARCGIVATGRLAWLTAVAVAGEGKASDAMLDCKASAGKLFIPEDTSAVAHGDANLAIDDFLSRALE
jgi:SAC3 family protein LENG8/THP3